MGLGPPKAQAEAVVTIWGGDQKAQAEAVAKKIARLKDKAQTAFESQTRLVEAESELKSRLEAEELARLKAKNVSIIKHVKTLAQYRFKERRSAVARYCKLNENEEDLINVNQDPKWNQDLYFEYEYKMLYCQVSKVSGTTWLTHLSK